MNLRPFRAAWVTAALHLPVAAATQPNLYRLEVEPATLIPRSAGTLASQAGIGHVLQAGHLEPDPASGIEADSPLLRIDPNSTTSPFAGVGSIFTDDDPSDPLGVICTATPISKWQILTAAHCLDIADGDGQSDVLPENAVFVLNFGSDFSHVIPAANIWVHPDWDGFQSLFVADDLAVLQLSQPIPDGVPIYPLADPSWLNVAPLTMVGYGASGDGVNGYYVDPEFQIKRAGANLLEYAELDDEGGPEVEVVAWDFEYEGDPARYDWFGIDFAFPNRLETTLGGGDSGGPSFMFNPDDPTDLTLYLAAVNTFSFWVPGVTDHDEAGKFGAGSGGVWLNASYQEWILTVPETSTWFAGAGLGVLALMTALRIRRAR